MHRSNSVAFLLLDRRMVPIVRLDKARRDDTEIPSESPRRPRPGRPAGFRHRSRGFRPELRTIAPSGAKRGRWAQRGRGSFNHPCAPELYSSILATGSSEDAYHAFSFSLLRTFRFGSSFHFSGLCVAHGRSTSVRVEGGCPVSTARWS